MKIFLSSCFRHNVLWNALRKIWNGFFADTDLCTFLWLFHIQTEKEKLFLKSREKFLQKWWRKHGSLCIPCGPPWSSASDQLSITRTRGNRTYVRASASRMRSLAQRSWGSWPRSQGGKWWDEDGNWAVGWSLVSGVHAAALWVRQRGPDMAGQTEHRSHCQLLAFTTADMCLLLLFFFPWKAYTVSYNFCFDFLDFILSCFFP